MATMIPPTPAADIPKSERRIHDILANTDVLPDWTFIHSSSHHNPDQNLPREIDFVALIPNYGMICIEVKGGAFYVRNGQWFRMHNHSMVESPTRQAEQAMYALQHELQQEFSMQSGPSTIPTECAVIFTDAKWPDNVRRPRATIIDHTDITNQKLELMLIGLSLRLRPAAGPKKLIPPTTNQVVNKIRHYLTPDFNMNEANTNPTTILVPAMAN